MQDQNISQVSRNTGIASSTLRYYEEIGLIHSIGRHGLKRLFDPEIYERLALISMGQAAGFTLEEIAKMFTSDGQTKIDKRVLKEKADELDKKIKKLTAMRDGLIHAVNCTAPSYSECPTFKRIMNVAMQGFFRNKVLNNNNRQL